MNTRWKSLFLAVFSACLLAGSVNARVCFLADLECQKGQSQPVVVDEGEKPCKERPEYSGETLVLDKYRCPTAMEYTSWVCKDSTGYYYREIGCADGYIDLEASEDGVQNKDKYDCSVVECGRCCLLDNARCPGDYKQCEDPHIGLGKPCKDKDGNELYESCKCPDRYNISVTECIQLGGSPANEVCDTLTTDCGCPKGYTFITPNQDPNDCPPECNGNGCTRKKASINLAAVGKKGMCIYDEVECNYVPPYECNSANGEYAKEEDCTGSIPYAVCEKDSNDCWQVTGCKTTSLGYQQTLVGSDAYCWDIAKDVSCVETNDPNCFEACNCVDEQSCLVSYNMKKGEDNKQYCEPECTTLGYMVCKGEDHFLPEDSMKYCRNGSLNDYLYYYLKCVKRNTCYPVDSVVDRRDDGYSYFSYVDFESLGVCELVLTKTEAEEGGYLTSGKYYDATHCYPYSPETDSANTEEEYLRLHECMSDKRDCNGQVPAPYGDENNEEPGWKTADVDDSSMANGKNCLNPAPTEYNDEYSEEKDENGLLLHDGKHVECGGKDYITDCECTTYNATPGNDKCQIVEIPLGHPVGDMLTEKVIFGAILYRGVFTGEYVSGCAEDEDITKRKYKKAYGYVSRQDDLNKKCLSEDKIFPEADDLCRGSEVCDGEVVYMNNDWKYCDGTCVTPQICTGDQACKTAVTIGDEKYCTNCVTPKTCGNEEKCIPEAIDAITEKPYCPEKSTCQHVCEIYAGDIELRYIVSGTSASDSDSCFISKKQFLLGGVWRQNSLLSKRRCNI